MFTIIYQDGNHVNKPDLDTAFLLPGNHYVFSVGTTFQVNQNDGVCYYNTSKEIVRFKVNHLELIDIEKINYSNTPPFRFSIYDHKTDMIQKIIPKSYSFDYALSSVIKTIISASQFPNWETYDTVIKIEEYKSEINVLKEQLQVLKKQNEELANSLDTFKKSSL